MGDEAPGGEGDGEAVAEVVEGVVPAGYRRGRGGLGADQRAREEQQHERPGRRKHNKTRHSRPRSQSAAQNTAAQRST